MNIPFLDLKATYRQIEKEIVPVMTHAMETGAFIGGPRVSAFEEAFAAFCETSHAIGVGSGTDALRFALIAAGIGPGDEVITVPNTFIATTEAISQVGARPVFVDIKEESGNMDPDKIEASITKRTRAIIPVHLYGRPADMDEILKIADRYKLFVIEDACQAHGAIYKGKKAGAMGHAGCFSFYPGKNLGAFGEAGAIVTNDVMISDKIKMIRDHGQKEKYYHQIEGFNGRLDAIQAAVLEIKLRYLPGWNDKRRQSARYYSRLLSEVPGVRLPIETEHITPVCHLYVIHVEKRDELQQFLSQKGVATGLHYPIPLHLQPAYAHLGYQRGAFPVAEKSAATLLSLPMFPELTTDQIEYVVRSIERFVG